jgi:hypothetical protein
MFGAWNNEADTFGRSGTIIAAFGMTIHERHVEGRKDVGLPIAKHSVTGLELRQFQAIIGIKPVLEQWRRHFAVFL